MTTSRISLAIMMTPGSATWGPTVQGSSKISRTQGESYSPMSSYGFSFISNQVYVKRTESTLGRLERRESALDTCCLKGTRRMHSCIQRSSSGQI